MKIMYVLQGESNSGKTSTLIKIDELIRKNSRFQREESIIEYKKDLTVILVLKDGTKVGINSTGDNLSSLTDDNSGILKGLEKLRGCDIIFCACTTSYGKLVDFIDSFRDKYKIFYIHKIPDENGNYDEENEKMAENLIKCAFALYENV